jgi:ankyrin repeat protein
MPAIISTDGKSDGKSDANAPLQVQTDANNPNSECLKPKDCENFKLAQFDVGPGCSCSTVGYFENLIQFQQSTIITLQSELNKARLEQVSSLATIAEMGSQLDLLTKELRKIQLEAKEIQIVKSIAESIPNLEVPKQLDPTQIQSEPVNVELINAELINVEPAHFEDAKSEPVVIEPINVEPINVEPINVEPINIEPINTETESTNTESAPIKPEPVQIEVRVESQQSPLIKIEPRERSGVVNMTTKSPSIVPINSPIVQNQIKQTNERNFLREFKKDVNEYISQFPDLNGPHGGEHPLATLCAKISSPDIPTNALQDAFKFLIEEKKVKIDHVGNNTDSSGLSSLREVFLHLSPHTARSELLVYLLSKSSERTNIQDNLKMTLVHDACTKIGIIGYDVFETIIDKGGDFNIKNKDSNTPLHFAFSNFNPGDDIKKIELIVDNSCDDYQTEPKTFSQSMSVSNDSQLTPIDYAFSSTTLSNFDKPYGQSIELINFILDKNLLQYAKNTKAILIELFKNSKFFDNIETLSLLQEVIQKVKKTGLVDFSYYDQDGKSHLHYIVIHANHTHTNGLLGDIDSLEKYDSILSTLVKAVIPDNGILDKSSKDARSYLDRELFPSTYAALTADTSAGSGSDDPR